MSAISRAALLVLLSLAATARVFAQCATWSPGFARPSTPLCDHGIVAGNDLDLLDPGGSPNIASFDDGSGAHLYALRQAFDSVSPLELVRWSGVKWDSVAILPQTAGIANARGPWAATDAGTPVILAVTQGIKVWRVAGSTVTQLGTLDQIPNVVGTFDAGNGPALYAAGQINTSPTQGFVRVWNGASWTAVGPTLFGNGIAQLYTFDDGVHGPRLYSVSGAVRVWDGSAWQLVGTSTGQRALQSLQGRLFSTTASGFFELVGNTWQDITPATGPFGAYSLLRAVDFGAGPRLVLTRASAVFPQQDDVKVYVYDGTAFTTLPGLFEGPVQDIETVPGPGGPRTYFSGDFDVVDDTSCSGLVESDGSSWSAFGRGFDTEVGALAAHAQNGVLELYAAGWFAIAGDAGTTPTLNGSARWQGGEWRTLGQLDASFHWRFDTLRSVDLGAGPVLYGGGQNILGNPALSVARFNGVSWSAMPGLGGPVHAFGSFEFAGARRLVAGATSPGSPNGNNVTWFDGTSWQPVGAGTNGTVAALESFDEGAGERLFAGGSFTTASSSTTGGVARWDSVDWSALGTGITGAVNALCVFDAQLYAGGTLTDAGGTSVANLARWDGTTWSDVPGGGANGLILALCVHDDGRGDALYVGGAFSSIGGITASNLARFDGQAWEPVDGGIDGVVRSLASVDDDGDGDAELFVGGRFQQTATVASSCIARLAGCPHSTSFCAGDGQYLDHTTPCPCGNDGAAGRGCASSFVADGALLEASGSTALDTLVLHVIDTPQSSLGIYLQHDAADDRVFHDGVLCASGNLIRLRRHFSVGGESMFPDSTDTTTVAQRGSVTPGSGATRYYSCFYRNASTTFCPPATANVSNGLRVSW